MKLEEYENILRTGTPSDRARAIAAASFTVRALPGDLQEDAINTLSKTVSGMLGDLSRLMAETGEP